MDIFSKIDKTKQSGQDESKHARRGKFEHIGGGLYVCKVPPKIEERDLSNYMQRSIGKKCEDMGRRAERRAQLLIDCIKQRTHTYGKRDWALEKKIQKLIQSGINFKLMTRDDKRILTKHFFYNLEYIYRAGFDIEDAWRCGYIASTNPNNYYNFVEDFNITS